MATGRNSTGCFLLRKLFAAGGCYTGTASNRCRWVSPSPLSLSLSLQLAVPPSTTTPVTRSRCWYCGSDSSLARIRLPTTNGSSSSSSCSSITAKPSIGDTFRWSGIPDASGTELHALARRLGTTTTTKVKSSVLPKHSDDDDNYDDGGGNDGLRRNTREWLRIPVGTWTRREISRGRFLIRQWSEVRGDARERAVQQTRILRRWMRERLAAAAAAAAAVETTTSTTIGDGESDGNDRSAVDTDSNELIEMLNRCLDSWRKASSRAIMTSPANINNTNPTEQSRSNPAADSSNRTSPSSESMKLMNLFWDASAALDDKKIRPCPKTCSMCMNVLALHPESPTACDDVLMVLERCRREQEATTDLRFYNVCLHTLAKCATHHPEAPHLVESIVQEMTAGSRSSTTHRSLNTACFVSLLHAWANTIPMSASASATASVSVDASASFSIAAGSPRKGGSNSETTAPLPAERIEAILDQMIRSYPHLVDTICFNICIDAWGKQGQPDKAESVLWRLHGYHRDSSERRNRRDESETETETESFPQIINRKNPRERQIRPNNVSYNSAINAWAKCGSNRSSGGKWDVVEAANRVELLLGHMRRHGYELTPETVGSAMEAYAGAPNPGRKVQGLLDELETMYSEGELSFSPPKVCYLMAIRAWGRTRSVGAERAEFLVQRMTELSSRDNDNDDGGSRSDLEPCVVVYTALLSAWAVSDAADAPERALRVFREMHRRASSSSGQSVASPNTISLNALLEAFCNHDRAEEARSLLVRVKHKVQPNSRSYHILLKGYAESKDPRAVEAAEELLRELESDYRNGAGGGIKPTAALYSQLLVAWGNSTRHDGAFRAEEIFWSMLRQDDDRISVRPDTTTLNCVLRAWSKSFEGGNAERAEAFLRKVQTEHSEDGLTADPVSYRHLIYAWAHSRRKQAPQRAEEHLDNALRLCASRSSTGTHPGWKLTRAHFKGVILAWEKSSDPNAPQHIQRLRDEMVRIFSK